VCLKDKNDAVICIGIGSNKKDAENDAAKKAIDIMGIL
jgi:dsRNA-specific ribonuclease